MKLGLVLAAFGSSTLGCVLLEQPSGYRRPVLVNHNASRSNLNLDLYMERHVAIKRFLQSVKFPFINPRPDRAHSLDISLFESLLVPVN